MYNYGGSSLQYYLKVYCVPKWQKQIYVEENTFVILKEKNRFLPIFW